MEEVESQSRPSSMGERDSAEIRFFNAPENGLAGSPRPETPNRSRASSEYSGSDYSQPQTPNEQPQPSFTLRGSDDMSTPTNDFEDIALNSRPNSHYPTAELSTTTIYPDIPEESAGETLQLPMTSSPQPQSPDGSDYSGPTSQSHRSSSNRTAAVSPVTPQDAHMSIYSLQSLALSESVDDYAQLASDPTADYMPTPREIRTKQSRKPNSMDMLENVWSPPWSETEQSSSEQPEPPTRQSTLFDMSKDLPLTPTTPTNESELKEEDVEDDETSNAEASANTDQSHSSSLTVMDTSMVWRTEGGRPLHTRRVSSLNAPTQIVLDPSEEDDIVLDWSTLDRTEEQEKEDKDLPEGVEDESTQFLLARLDQENAKFTTAPKSSTNATANTHTGRARAQTRPPSIAHLKKLVSQQDAPSIRYSLVPDAQNQAPDEPPPMTELEFWAALVQDYPSTAARLPTLTTTKIRAGIPPPLRGVVWASMSGARDINLEEAFETLKNEESAYEGIINKDIGRSFPGVEMFREQEGEGQKMLARVLKCFSLHDKDIGYCQGLGLLVGPLLMNMSEKESFCVLVRLMEHYALRPSFLPSLSGLHMRIFQFSVLLNQNHPELADHLGDLGIEPAYLSQWFLSLFAVTCPLPLLFRIYDVIFAEGANETVMRVALSLFRRNEEKMLESTEFEDVMQLLLGRSIWDVYGGNADELVDDFTSLGHIVSHARLAELEREFESRDGDSVGESAGFLPDVQAAASRFLGRLWAPTPGHTPNKDSGTTLAPQSAEKDSSVVGYLSRPRSFLRRTPSKQSLNGVNESVPSDSSASSGSGSITSTAPTETEVHDSAGADVMSMKSKSESLIGSTSAHAQHVSATSGGKEQELQTEIEDLLMALSEMQREQAQMSGMLQKEREERSDDHRVVRQLLSKLTNGESERKTGQRSSMPPPPRPKSQEVEEIKSSDKRRTLPPRPRLHVIAEAPPQEKKDVVEAESKDAVDELVNEVQCRLDTNRRFTAIFETKAQLRTALTRAREQLAAAEAQIKDLGERADTAESSLTACQDENESLQLEADELRGRVNDDFKEKQKLELKIENLQIQMRLEAKALEKKSRNASLARTNSSGEVPTVNSLESPTRSRQGSLSSNPANAAGLRELKLGNRDSTASLTSNRSAKTERQSVEEWPKIPPPIDIPSSPPKSPSGELTPTAPPLPSLPESSSLTVPVPDGPGFSRRTSSLATRDVFATQKHEPVPDEALLLELVNAKTAEATARQEIDEMKKSMQVQKRKAEESLLELQAAVTNAKMEALKAREEAEDAREEARSARAEVFDASPLPTPVSSGVSTPIGRGERFPVTGGAYERSKRPTPPRTMSSSPVENTEPKEVESSGIGSWFWNKRTVSTPKVPGIRSLSGDR